MSYVDLAVVHFLRPRFVDANLSNANLEFANLHEADLQGCDLDSAHLRGANLFGANLAGIRSWHSIANLQQANILGIKNPPEGFREWAIEKMGAEEIPPGEWLTKHEDERDQLRKMIFES
jgi:uncharacterized protein YjbI with pentapeptide repeats